MTGAAPGVPIAVMTDDHLTDAVGHDLMKQIGLTVEQVMSGDGDSFVTLLCRDDRGELVVLKYVRPDAPADAYRRLRNESRLLQHGPTEWPLRLLRYRLSGPGYLVTELDRGRLLQPATIGDEPTVRGTATALAVFQEWGRSVYDSGVRDREAPAWYFLKVLAKNLLHLCPSHLTAWEAMRTVAIVAAALPAILKRSTVSHGDFLPTNLLYHDEDGSVTFTDLEAFSLRNHPLFDVLAMCTIDERELAEWSWQPAFLRSYLAHMTGDGRLNAQSREFQRAYRGILTFFLVYRFNEARLFAQGGRYFDGVSKARFVRRKLMSLLGGLPTPADDTGWAPGLAVRRRNLLRVLPARGFREHLRAMRPFELFTST